MTNLDAAGKFYLDVNGLDALRLQAQKNPNAALPSVAKQFEAVFMDMMLKSMRDASMQDGPFDSEQTKMYTSMLDQQISQLLAKKGLGLAAIMEKQLGGSSGPVTPNAAPQYAYPSPEEKPEVPAQGRDFISKMLPYAREASGKTGIPAKFMLGQAALETGWGKHEIKGANGRMSHNLFGIKADKHWKGAVVTAPTTEYVNGVPRKVYQNFRAYSSYAECFRDYAHLLSSNPRYATVAGSSQDAAGFAQGLQSAGYATDPRYSEKMMRILGENIMREVA